MIGVCQAPYGDEQHYPVERHDEPCHVGGCDCTPKVYIELAEHQRTLNEDWIPALEEIDRLRCAQSDLRLDVQTAEYQRRLVARAQHGGVAPDDWADLVDTFRVVVRARTGQRVANRAERRPRCFCGAPLAKADGASERVVEAAA